MYDLEAMIERIKALKKASKLSNEALAKLSGIPKGTLSKILGSETKDPQISNIIKISKALGVTADFIIFGKEEPKYDNIFMEYFSFLNSEGQKKVIDYIRDLMESGKYSVTTKSNFCKEQKIHNIYRAAMSSDNHEHQIEKRSKSDIEKLANAEKVTSEEDL